ncbi:iron-containing alcohol dehydrogenase [Antarctobacter jejuensis]|uniref:iron-containing alcohol dehydrogenase n=1 Tax=Antarctobacter jejuensis TaxID=1439938 RepID=UPI003FD5D999
MTPFGLTTPRQMLFGRDCRLDAAQHVAALGQRVLLVRGRSVAWVDTLAAELRAKGLTVTEHFSNGEPTLDLLRDGLTQARAAAPDCVVAVGGGATIDYGKALSALIRSDSDPATHLEVVGEGRPIGPDPLPLVALPTTAGTGAEATRNAVITVPEAAVKVSLRDNRMVPDLAIVDPALTDGAPKGLTLATGLDAITQLIESYLSIRANPLSYALCAGMIPDAIAALARLMQEEDADARDTLAKASFLSGIALANVGLGIVHGLAAVIGGHGGAHGAICGRLLPAALEVNQRALRDRGQDAARVAQVDDWLKTLDPEAATGTLALRRFMDRNGLETLEALGCPKDSHPDTARDALKASSTKSNPVVLTLEEVLDLLTRTAAPLANLRSR